MRRRNTDENDSYWSYVFSRKSDDLQKRTLWEKLAALAGFAPAPDPVDTVKPPSVPVSSPTPFPQPSPVAVPQVSARRPGSMPIPPPPPRIMPASSTSTPTVADFDLGPAPEPPILLTPAAPPAPPKMPRERR